MRQVLVPHSLDPRVAPALGSVVHTRSGRTMGTTWQVRWVGGRGTPGPEWTAGMEAELNLVVAQMSLWQAGSDLSRYNRACAGSRHRLPEPFRTVLSCAIEVARDSGGACDPTAGMLVDLWGFGPTGRHDQPDYRPPTAEAVDAARAQVGWQRVEFDAATGRILQPGGVRLDLSAIAKGHAVDRVLQHLQGRGVDSALVEVGGELRGIGVKPNGQPWWVALEPPPDAVAGVDPMGDLRWGGDSDTEGGSAGPALAPLHETVIALHGLSVATSGDHLRCHAAHGVRRAHTIDPRHGWPVDLGLASVSVVHTDCMAADAWSTALMVMGLQAGLATANERGLAARFLQRLAPGRYREHVSLAFEALRS